MKDYARFLVSLEMTGTRAVLQRGEPLRKATPSGAWAALGAKASATIVMRALCPSRSRRHFLGWKVAIGGQRDPNDRGKCCLRLVENDRGGVLLASGESGP